MAKIKWNNILSNIEINYNDSLAQDWLLGADYDGGVDTQRQ